MTLVAAQIHAMTDGETRAAAVSFQDLLDDDELLTGTPTVVDLAGELTLASKAINTAAIPVRINGVFVWEVAIGKAVQFTVTGGTAGTTYTIRVTCGSDGSPAQTVSRRVQVRVVAD